MKTPENYYLDYLDNVAKNTHMDANKLTVIETIRLAQLETIDEAVRVLEEELDSALAFNSIPDFDEMKQKLYELKKEITNGKEN